MNTDRVRVKLMGTSHIQPAMIRDTHQGTPNIIKMSWRHALVYLTAYTHVECGLYI